MAKTDSLKTLLFIVLILLVITAGAYLIMLVVENGGFYSAYTSTKMHSHAVSQTEDTQEEVQTGEEPETVSDETIAAVEDDAEEQDIIKTEATVDTSVNDNCLNKYNLTRSTIIFYYQDEPHSNVMIPIVEELEATYTFYKTNELWNNQFNSCFGLSGATPAFVCAGTGQKLIGEVSKETLADFASDCS